MMRVVLVLALLALVPASARAQRRLDERFAVTANGYIHIMNMTGSVKVTGWDRDSIALSGTAFEPKGTPFLVHRGEGTVKLGIWDPDAARLEPTQIEVLVPRGSHISVKAASADVTVEGVSGGVDVYSVTGRITVSGTPREVFAESMGGGIDVAVDTRTVRATTASGNIAVRGAIADASARTVSGDLSVEGSRFERGRFESVDGDIRYTGEIGRASWLDFVNHSGGIQFILPPKVAADFAVSTFEGGLEDRYGLRVATSVSKLRGREYTFAIGPGGGRVTVRSFKGQVVVARK